MKKNYLKFLIKGIQSTLKIFNNNISVDFFWRYIFLMSLELTSKMIPERIKKQIYIPLIKKTKNPFLFNTSFGTFVGKSLDARGRMHKDYEFRIREYVREHYSNYKPNENEIYCINIGANQGRWAIELAKLFNYKIIAFEAVPSIFNELMANIYLSGLSNKIIGYNYALGNYDGLVSFNFLEEHEGMSHVETQTKPRESLLQLPIKKFDNLQLSLYKNNIKLFIIDVEGYEYEVLQGMEETLKNLKEVDLIVEIWDKDPNKEKVFQFMNNLGFSYRRLICNHEDYLFYKK